MRIPQTFHFIWLNPVSKQKTKKSKKIDRLSNFSSWSTYHPGYHVTRWSESGVRLLLADHYPGLLHIFNALEKCTWLQTLIARIAILHRFGGIYADHDIECINPVSQVIDRGASAFVTTNSIHHYGDTSVRWSLIGAIPNHPVIAEALKRLGSIKFDKPIEKCCSKKGRQVFETLQKAVDAMPHTIIVLDSNSLLDYNGQVPFMGQFTLGIYRSPRKHHYENWVHSCVRKVKVWSIQNPTASRVVTYFILGMITGVILNIIFYFMRCSLDKRFKK